MATPAPNVEDLPAPSEGILMTHFIIVRDVVRSRAFYSDVLGGEVVLEENPCIVKLANGWVIMNPGGPGTPDSGARLSPVRERWRRPHDPGTGTRTRAPRGSGTAAARGRVRGRGQRFGEGLADLCHDAG
jgi:catechol 2,3-dioxygenase-like lactoylglutathione lyase family enzyme